MPKSFFGTFVLTLMLSVVTNAQTGDYPAENPVDDTKNLINQKDVEIHNLNEELEYIKKELRELQQINTSLRDSLENKQTVLETQPESNLDENDNLRIYRKTIEDDRRLSQEIIGELQEQSAPPKPTAQPIVTVDDSEFRAKYNEALNQYFDGKIAASQNNFIKLLEWRQDHPLSDNCQYWLGECLYSQQKYREAIDIFKGVSNLGDGNKADAALFKIGLSYLKLNERNEARSAFSDLEKYYPQSELVPKARQYNLTKEKF